MDSQQFFSIIERLDSVNDLASMESVCDDFCKVVGVPFYLLSVIEQIPLSAPGLGLLTNCSECFLQYFIKDNLDLLSPFLTSLMAKQVPIRWDKACSDKVLGATLKRAMIEKAETYGVCNGLSIPIKSVSGEMVVFNMAVGNVDNARQLLDNAIPFAHTFATHLFECYSRVVVQNKRPEKLLTKRELDCLFWACEGKTAWEISRIVDVSERTVLFHLKNGAVKLRACNRQHAVALATMKGIIKPNISCVKGDIRKAS